MFPIPGVACAHPWSIIIRFFNARSACNLKDLAKQEKCILTILTRQVFSIIDNKRVEWTEVNFWISNLKFTCFLWAYAQQTYQCAKVLLKSSALDICILKSRIGASPRWLAQCGSPYGSTGMVLDGTVHVIELFVLPNNIYPPSFVVISHHTLLSKNILQKLIQWLNSLAKRGPFNVLFITLMRRTSVLDMIKHDCKCFGYL